MVPCASGFCPWDEWLESSGVLLEAPPMHFPPRNMPLARLVHSAVLFAALIGCAGTCERESGSPEPSEGSANGFLVTNPSLPGIHKPNSELDTKLRAALAKKPKGYTPRTEHLEADGRPTYVNRLIMEISPYLLQHAHNPVNWSGWSEEAFERARKEDKPVLLSVGYATCHWCHVMERESFEDVEIATYINKHFVPIKVDREERPDIDDIYMTAVNMLVGRGGWPMTVVMTPDRQPFFGGTYFPPRSGVGRARKGFLEILQELSGKYQSDRNGVMADAQQLSMRLQQQAQPAAPGTVPNVYVLSRTATGLARSFDRQLGGFGRAPKFPQPSRVAFLMRYYRRTDDPAALKMVTKTLRDMARGGMYDQLGGGFHRYSTDAKWLVPHFEKMLYDNAQLAQVYVEGFQLTGDPEFRKVATEILDYVISEMTSPQGAFYSATDADSPVPGKKEREEGWFFTWTPREITDVVGAEDAKLVATHWGVTPRGNFEHRNIFFMSRSEAATAQLLGIPLPEFQKRLTRIKAALYKRRSTRPPPLRDDKVLTAWNGLMISAFARAGLAFAEPRYTRVASTAAKFLLKNSRDTDGRLMRSYMDGQAKHRAFAPDYAFLIAACLDLYEATGNVDWFISAIRLQQQLDKNFLHEGGGYFMTANDHEELLTREKPASDGAVPSGNSLALDNLLRLAEYTTEDRYRIRAEELMSAFGTNMNRWAGGMTRMLAGVDRYHDRALEIVIVCPNNKAEAQTLLNELGAVFLPNRVLSVVTVAELSELKQHIPLLDGKLAIKGKATAFVCERGRCELPTSDPKTFAKQIRKVKPLSSPPPPALTL